MKGNFEEESSALQISGQTEEGAIAPVEPKVSSLEINLDSVNQLDLTTERSRQFFGGFFEQLDVVFDDLDRDEARELIRAFLPDLIRYQHLQRNDRIQKYFAEGAEEVLAEVRTNFRRETDRIIANKDAIISELIADFERSRTAKT